MKIELSPEETGYVLGLLMPESVTDRPTKSHEMIYLLAKQQRYTYDADAIREPPDANAESKIRMQYPRYDFVNKRDSDNGKPDYLGVSEGKWPTHRNKRTVWTVATQPYSEAHFATFPEDLIKPCILAGSRAGDTVLDPFGGSGTTGKVALELGRKAILIELNPEYAKLAKERTNVTPGFF